MISAQQLPLAVALVLVTILGAFLLNRADEQSRDTIRKHHLADIEQSLYFTRELHGTFPPYDMPSWCGLLNDPKNVAVRSQVEEVLRAQNNKYANEAKPFPEGEYFYWKRSPAVFELYASLEQDNNNERNSLLCDNNQGLYFDYGLTSRWREDLINLTS